MSDNMFTEADSVTEVISQLVVMHPKDDRASRVVDDAIERINQIMRGD